MISSLNWLGFCYSNFMHAVDMQFSGKNKNVDTWLAKWGKKEG